MVKQIVVLFLVASAATSVASAQQVRLLVPRADSPTAMIRCGAQLEQVKAEIGATRRYVFTGEERLTGMRYCVREATTSVVDERNAYRVPEGTRGWLSEDGRKVVLEECINDASCEGCPAAPPPPPPTLVPPPPAPTPPPPPPPPAPPACEITGDPTGFVGTATNGTGRWLFGPAGGELAEQLRTEEKFVPPAGEPGTYEVRFVVSGEGGEVSCQRFYDVYRPLEAAPPPPPPAPLARKARKIPCWNWPFGKFSLPACVAGAGLAAWAITGGEAAAVLLKPGTPAAGWGDLP